ncbi:DNA breaking-rejoining protein [Salmonella enterica]|nr:DNA breaking-rejoining protein [Salmonella enterica]
MQILKVGFNLQAINDEIALFSCGGKVSGLIHLPDTDELTVILDGGYVLGRFKSPDCALLEISLLAAKVHDGEKAGYGSYRQHKRTFMEQVFITVH